MNPTLYDVIGLTPEASEKQIYRAVKRATRLVKESDVSVSEKKNLIKMMKRARDTLMDPRTREEYDRTIGIETIRDVRDDSGMTHARSSHPMESLMGSLVGSNGSDGSDGIGGSMVPFESSGPIGSMISNHMNMIQSIIPQGFGDLREMGKGMQPGTFHFMEYTKTRNSSGGYDEYGITREGDTNNDHVTEKRFHKKG